MLFEIFLPLSFTSPRLSLVLYMSMDQLQNVRVPTIETTDVRDAGLEKEVNAPYHIEINYAYPEK